MKYSLYYTKQTGTTWSPPVLIKSFTNNQDLLGYTGARYFTDVKIAVGPNSVPNLTWTEGTYDAPNLSDVYFSYLNGSSFSAPQNLSNNSNPGTFTWYNPQSFPLGNSTVRLTAIGSDIYASGLNYVRRLYRYSTISNTWALLPEVPGDIAWSGADQGDMCVLNGTLYLIDIHGVLITYTPSSGTWLVKTGAPTTGTGFRMRAINGKLYAISLGATTTLQEYNPNTDSWATKATIPTARDLPAVSALNNKLQVIGGRDANDRPTSSFEEYDPVTNTWVKKPDLLSLKDVMSGADVLNGKIYVAAREYTSIEVYDPALNLWSPATKLATPMGDGDIVVARGELYLLGTAPFLRGTLGGIIDMPPKISNTPQIAVDGNNITHIFWRDGCYAYGVDGQTWPNTTTDCTLFYRTFSLADRTMSAISKPLGNPLTWVGADYVLAIASDNTPQIIFKQFNTTLQREVINHAYASSGGWRTQSNILPELTGYINGVTLNRGATGVLMLAAENVNAQRTAVAILFSKLANGVWGNPETVLSGNSNFSDIKVTSDNNGTPLVIFGKNRNSSIYLTKRLTNGNWINGLIANSAAQQSQHGTAATNGVSNTLALAYESTFNSRSEIFFNSANLGVDFVPPTVTLNGPGAASKLVSGSSQHLSWNASDDVGLSTMMLQYTIDGGATHTTIATELSASGTLDWVVPDITASAVQIVAVATDAASNQGTATSNTFSVAPKTLIDLVITGPGVIDEGASGNYAATAYYDNGTSATVNANFGLQATSFATLSGSTLTGKSVSSNQSVTLTANYLERNVSKQTTYVITIHNLPDALNPFSFNNAVTSLLRSLLVSNTVTISTNSSLTSFPISITGGEYSINGGRWTKLAGNINVGNQVKVRMLSPATCGASTSATLTIGGVSGTFTATATGSCTIPGAGASAAAFAFDSIKNVHPNAPVESGQIVVSGITTTAEVAIEGGEYAINNTAWSSSRGTIRNGQTIKVRLVASPLHNAEKKLLLSIGSTSAPFSVTTNARSLSDLKIVGPGTLDAGASANYTLLASYDNGSSASVSGTFNYSGNAAALTGMQLNARRVTQDQIVTLNARYIEDGIDKEHHLPVTIKGTDHPIAVKPMISAGSHSALFLDSDGAVWMTGRNKVAATDFTHPTRIEALRATAVATGESHWLALQADGTVFSWGSNDKGQLGLPGLAESAVPTQVTGLANITAVAAHLDFSLALDTNGHVWQWGRGNKRPVLVPELEQVQAIAGNDRQGIILALKQDATVWSWRDGSATPIPGLTQISAIAAGWAHGLAVKQDGTVSSWWLEDLSIDYGQLGNGVVNAVREPRQVVKVVDLEGVIDIAAGDDSSMALLKDGSVRVWGQNIRGELGVINNNDESGGVVKPTPVKGLSNVIAITSNRYYSNFALNENGTIYSWGAGLYGILANDNWQPGCWLFGCITLSPTAITQKGNSFLMIDTKTKEKDAEKVETKEMQ